MKKLQSAAEVMANLMDGVKIAKSNWSNALNCYVTIYNGRIVIVNSETYEINDFDGSFNDDNWYVWEKPIVKFDFMTAVRYMGDGKKVRVCDGDNDYVYYKDDDGEIVMIDVDGDCWPANFYDYQSMSDQWYIHED